MKNYLRKKLKLFLYNKGIKLSRLNNIAVQKEYYNTLKNNFFLPQNQAVFSIIFSKDRAMQLDAFLRSYFENVENYAVVKVLYHTSTLAHEKSYTDLKNLYAEKPVVFIKEENFRNQIIEILEQSTEDRVILFVDDMLFTRKIDFKKLGNINPLENILALSRGKDLVYSTVLAKKIKTPHFKNEDDGMISFSWKEQDEFSDWTFPMGVSGYMYARREILYMLKTIAFKAPNSMEGEMQHFNFYFVDRRGICGENVVTPCIHANLTQTEGFNPVLGSFSTEDLLTEWNKGNRIDHVAFFGLPVSVAELQHYSFIKK